MTDMQQSDMQIDSRGLFSPASMTWKINKEALLLMGGTRALLMQIAHPKVARGVADHSDFQHRPLDRLRRTLNSIYALVLGDRETVLSAARAIRGRHASVKGDMPAPEGHPAGGGSYTADDPELLLWVFATLIDTAVYTYELLFQSLSDAQKACYYRESCRWGELLGIPGSRFPENYRQFQEYVNSTLHSDAIAIEETTRQVAEGVLHPLPRFPRWIFHPGSRLAIFMLPAPLRSKYGFSLSLFQQRGCRLAIMVLRFLGRFTPLAIRMLPQARRLRKRWHESCN